MFERVSVFRCAGFAYVLPVYLAIATASGFVDYRVRAYPDHAFTSYVPEIMAGGAEAPGRYRILGPRAYIATEWLTGLSPRDSWIVFRWLCLFGALIAAHVYFRTWFASGPAVTGALLTTSVLPLTFTNSWPHPDHLLELMLFTLACACIARGWRLAFLLALSLAAFNRETSVFLLPLYLFASPATRRHLTWVACAAGLWMAIYLGLRGWLGWAAYDPWQVQRNLAFLTWFPADRDLYYRLFSWFAVVLAGPLLILTVSRWKAQPRFVKVAAAIVSPAFMAACFLFSSIIEARIFTPLLPLLVPGALIALFPIDRTALS